MEYEVSVVIPTFNMKHNLVNTVRAVLTQNFEFPYEIVIIDDGSTDGTAKIVKRIIKDQPHKSIKYIYIKHAGPAQARNIGIRKSSGKYLAFTDSDCIPQKEWLGELIREFTSQDIAGVGGLTKGANQSLLDSFIDRVGILNPTVRAEGVTQLITCNACYRRNILLDIGLFNEGFKKPGGEDAELSHRIIKAGYTLKFSKTAIVLHEHKKNLIEHLYSMYTYGQGRRKIAELHSEKIIRNPIRLLLELIFNVKRLLRDIWKHRYNGLVYSICFTLLGRITEFVFIFGYVTEGYSSDKKETMIKSPHIDMKTRNKVKAIFPLKYKTNPLPKYLKLGFKILDQKVHKNTARIPYDSPAREELLQRFSKLPEYGCSAESTISSISKNLFDGIPRWRNPKLVYNVGAPVNSVAAAAYALALDQNIYNINDGLAGNALIAEEATVKILADLANITTKPAGYFVF